MSMYSAINVDIIGSRDLINRKIIQLSLKEYIERMNDENENLFLAPITFTLGDEWQIVLKAPFKSYDIIEKFQRFLKKYEVDIYAGVGIGTISTDIYKDTRLMDGECFIRAREAIEVVKSRSRFYNKQISSKESNVYFIGPEVIISRTSSLVHFVGEEVNRKPDTTYEVAITKEENDEVGIDIHNGPRISGVDLNTIINTIVENTEVLKSKITEKQMEMISLYEEEGSYNNIIMKRPDMYKASISQKLNDSNYFLIDNNKTLIRMLLKLYCESKEGNANGF